MTPPCPSFPASELPDRIQQDDAGRRRKLPDGQRRVDLAACELLSMLQYNCEVETPVTARSQVLCFPIERLFRRCTDRNGPFLVETTEWEKSRSHPRQPETSGPGDGGTRGDASARRRPLQWLTSWLDSDDAASG